MKRLFYILAFLPISLFTSNAHALHGNPEVSGTIQYCSDSLLCDYYPSIEPGSTINAFFTLDTPDPFPNLGDVIDYQIYISNADSTSTSLIDLTNSSITFADFTAIADESTEFTEFTSGMIIIDTTLAITGELDLPSELRFNFDEDRIDFYAATVLAASTSPVPVPAAIWLFGSGLLGLVGFARRKANG